MRRTARAPEAATAGADAGLLDALREAVDDLGPDAARGLPRPLRAPGGLLRGAPVGRRAGRPRRGARHPGGPRGATASATALRAEVGDPDGPTIAVLSEYDALPGIGHGCGHNVIATAGLGAFLALAARRRPAAGPGRLARHPGRGGRRRQGAHGRHGAFDGVDAALMVHPFTYDIADPLFLGRRQLRATFTGITSHASAQPFMGRNALDAVNLMYTGVGLHRQQMPPTDRVHGVVTAGGERPNVIPEHAEMLFYLRSEYPESLAVLSERLADIARGAALMTGCGVELAVGRVAGVPPGPQQRSARRGWTTRYAERGRTVLPPDVVPRMFAGSTDFGNVSFRVPGVHAMVSITDDDISLHTREFADAAVSAGGRPRWSLDSACALAAVRAD